MKMIRVLSLLFLGGLLAGCATDRPLVKGLFDPGGVIYRDQEAEEFGSRDTLKVRGLEF